MQSPTHSPRSQGIKICRQRSSGIITMLFLFGMSCCESFNLGLMSRKALFVSKRSMAPIHDHQPRALSTLLSTCLEKTQTIHQHWLPSSRRTGTSLSMVTPLFHVGHSHSHASTHYDESHDKEDGEYHLLAGLSPKQRAKALRRRRLRQMALWLFCALATLGPKIIKTNSPSGLLGGLGCLQKGDWLIFSVSILAISSADKIGLI